MTNLCIELLSQLKISNNDDNEVDNEDNNIEMVIAQPIFRLSPAYFA